MAISKFSLMLVLAGGLLLRADQVTLKNGDRFTGSIVKKDAKSLTIKTESYGSVVVPWADVKTLTTDGPVHIEMSGGKVEKTTIGTRGEAVVIGERELSLADVVAIRSEAEQAAYERLLNPSWTEVWAGRATFGFAGTQGNAETRTMTIGVTAARETNEDKTNVYFSGIRASAMLGAVEATTAQAVRGGWGYSRNLLPQMFLNVFNDYEYDRFQNLDLRFVVGGGAGYIAWKTDRGRLDLLGGLAYNREKFGPSARTGSFTRNSAEAYFGDDLTHRLNSITSVYQNLRFFTNLTNGGEYRMNVDLGANTKLFRWLTWNIALSDRFLSNPVPGRVKNDFLYTTGIGITFER